MRHWGPKRAQQHIPDFARRIVAEVRRRAAMRDRSSLGVGWPPNTPASGCACCLPGANWQMQRSLAAWLGEGKGEEGELSAGSSWVCNVCAVCLCSPAPCRRGEQGSPPSQAWLMDAIMPRAPVIHAHLPGVGACGPGMALLLSWPVLGPPLPAPCRSTMEREQSASGRPSRAPCREKANPDAADAHRTA